MGPNDIIWEYFVSSAFSSNFSFLVGPRARLIRPTVRGALEIRKYNTRQNERKHWSYINACEDNQTLDVTADKQHKVSSSRQ